MSNKSITWILQFTANLPNDEEKIKCLRANEHVLKPILRYTFDPNLKWLLPPGRPPFNPNIDKYNEDGFYREIRKLYLFVEGGNNNLTQMKREMLFIDMLQALPTDDAELLLSMKERKLPMNGITSKLALKAFPGLY